MSENFCINYGLIVVDEYWGGDINHIIHFVGYQEPITNYDKEIFVSELANTQQDWSPIVDLEKEGLKVVEAPLRVIEYYREMLK